MKKKLITLLAVLMASIMMLAACTTRTESDTDGEKVANQDENATIVSDTEEDTEADSGNESGVEADEVPSWKRDTTPYTLTWFVAYDWYGKTFDPELNLGDKHILEETGITLDIQVGSIDKLNALISTGQLPDMVTFDAIAPQRLLLENNGLVLPLEQLAKEHAPDLNVPESMKNWYRNDDGNWYGVASYYYGDERTTEEFGGFYVSHTNNYVRTDVLEQIGMTLEEMETKEGFYNALKYVADNDVTYDGKVMTPYVNANPEQLAKQFGAAPEDEEGNLLNIQRQPEYLEAILYINKMYRDGIITSEEFTRGSAYDLVASGNVFAATGWPVVSWARQDLHGLDQDARMMYAGQIKDVNQGEKIIIDGVASAGWTTTMITSMAERPDRAIQFMAYMTDEMNTLSANMGYGAFDIIDGIAVMKPEVEAEYSENWDAANAKYNLNVEYFVDWTIVQKYTGKPDDSEKYFVIDHYNQEHDPNIIVYDSKAFMDVEPEAGSDIALLQISIGDIWGAAYPEMVMADSEEEAVNIYNETIMKMDEAGLTLIDEYKNGRFLENKQKLKLDFAWPGNK